MLSFASVFANSFVAKFCVFGWGDTCTDHDTWSAACQHSFLLWIFVYGFVVTCLSLLEVTEMLAFQMVLSAARFLLVAVIVLVSLVGLFTDPVDNGSTHAHPPYVASSFEIWKSSGLIGVLETALFSMLITFGVPELITPLRNANDARKLLLSGMGLITFFYAIVGISATVYFGADKIQDQINLTFDKFRGGASPDDHVPGWARTIQFFVGIFPALDVISMFPLICIALANTIFARLIRFESLSMFGGRTIKIFSRLVAALPPVIIPIAVHDLSKIVSYATIPGVMVGLVAPTLVQAYSVRLCRKAGVDPKTPYSWTPLLHPAAWITMGLIALAYWGMEAYGFATQ
mmetsp:Transcript_6008/g.13238  ORF Transcript_6008/g.13238 Transcript_6008/m.13238 type:complete len:346 (-) Transcript_6008:24-1061(-)